jgi:hypothetical protein
MPKVNGKKYPYTKEGKKKAKDDAKRKGLKIKYNG